MHRLRRRPASRPCFAATSVAVFFIHIVYPVSMPPVKSGTPAQAFDPIRDSSMREIPLPARKWPGTLIASMEMHRPDAHPTTRQRGDK
jgi:hypothetical protein